MHCSRENDRVWIFHSGGDGNKAFNACKTDPTGNYSMEMFMNTQSEDLRHHEMKKRRKYICFRQFSCLPTIDISQMQGSIPIASTITLKEKNFKWWIKNISLCRLWRICLKSCHGWDTLRMNEADIWTSGQWLVLCTSVSRAHCIYIESLLSRTTTVCNTELSQQGGRFSELSEPPSSCCCAIGICLAATLLPAYTQQPLGEVESIQRHWLCIHQQITLQIKINSPPTGNR